MSIRPALPTQAGKQAARRRALFCGALVLSAVVLGANPPVARAAGDESGSVMAKMAATYQTAKAYEGTVTVTQSGKVSKPGPTLGKSFVLIQTQHIKFKGPNLVVKAVKFTGEGAAAGQVERGDGSVTSDGKSVYIYNIPTKQYVKRPCPPKIGLEDVVELLKKLPAQAIPGMSMLAPSKVGDRAVYVVQIKPQMPAGLTPDKQKMWQDMAAKSQAPRLMIDKQNYLLLAIDEVDNGIKTQISLSGQTLNPSLGSDQFTFVKPAGSKEYIPQKQSVTVPGVPGGVTPAPGGTGIPGLPHK